MNVGDPVVVSISGAKWYGRVVSSQGGTYNVRTPSNSEAEIGGFWVRETMPFEREILLRFERYESHRGRLPYGGVFSPRDMARWR